LTTQAFQKTQNRRQFGSFSAARFGNIAILALAFALRAANLTRLPVFYDEANYIRWAQQTHNRLDLSIGLKAVSTLQLWILALFLDFSPSSLWVGRFVSAMAGVLTVALSYAIARQLYHGRSTAQLAALLYAVIPYALFHDRLAQHDGLLSLFLALVVYLSIRIFSLKSAGARFALTPGLILAFGLALLTKRSGILFIGTPFLAAFILRPRTDWRASWPWALGASIGLLLITLPLFWITAANAGDQLAAQVTAFDRNSLTALLAANFVELWDWFSGYFRLPALLFLGIAVIYNLIVHRRRPDIFLLIVAFIPIGFFTGLSTRWYPRYLMPAIFPLVILIAGQITLLSARPKNRKVPFLIFLTALITLPMLYFDLNLINAPANAPLPQTDRRQYIEGMPAGYGLPEAAAYLTQIANRQPIYIWRNSRNAPARHGFPLYLPEHPNIKLKRFSTLDKSWAEIESNFDNNSKQRLTYILLNLPREKGVPGLEEVPQLTPEQKFFKPGNKGFIGVYRWLPPLEYLLLSGNLRPDAAIALPAGVDITLMPAAQERFNLLNLDKSISLPQLLKSQDFDYVVLNDRFLQENGLRQENGDLTQLPVDWNLEASDQDCRWRIFRIWKKEDIAPAAVFGEETKLLGAQMPTSPWPSGEALPLTLYWQSSLNAPDQDLAVFLHGVNRQGQLVTQQDATWLNGRFPALRHQETDLLSQRFTLDLSGLAGELCFYTGFYHRSSGKRVTARQNKQPLPNNAFMLGCGSVSLPEN